MATMPSSLPCWMTSAQFRSSGPTATGAPTMAGMSSWRVKACQRQFGEDDDLHALAFGNGYLLLRLGEIELRVGNLHCRDGCCDFYKTVLHKPCFYLIVTCVAP